MMDIAPEARLPLSSLSRRGFITGLVSLLAAPAIVRAASLMDLRGVPLSSFPLAQLKAEGMPMPYDNELAYGYVITRQALEKNLYAVELEDALHIEAQDNLDCLHVSGPRDAIIRSWRRLIERANLA